jgi:hypothetical protein
MKTTKQHASFFPARNGGKYHRRWRDAAGSIAYCGDLAADKAVEIDEKASPIVYPAGTDISTVHPVVCKRCLKALT